MQSLFQNVRYALRQLRKSPGFTLTAVLTIALGIGANTAIFTLVNGILLRSLPVADSSTLYRVGDTGDCCVEGGFPGDASKTGDFSIFSTALYDHLRNNTPEFESLAAMQAGQWRWSMRRGEQIPRSLRGEFVSGNYFTTFGLPAFSGRLFNDNDDTLSAPPSVVLSYASWQHEFDADPSMIGATVYIQARPYTVIGIAPPGFFGDRVSDSPPDFWMPIHTEPYLRAESSVLTHEESHWLYLVGRVRPGVSAPTLQSRLSVTLRQWILTRPTLLANGGNTIVSRMHVVVVPAGGGIQSMQDYFRSGLRMLMILSSIVLIIACANIANLMLARSTVRRTDVAVRMALGAGRGAIVRQIVTESVVLSLIGGAVGVGIANIGARTILSLAFPEARNMPISAAPSPAVLGFAFLASLVTGILFGAAPAWLLARSQPADMMRGAGRSTRDHSGLPQRALVVFQVALSIVLLAGAILMTRSLARLEHQDFGVTTDNRYVLHIDPAGAGYSLDRMPGLYRQLEERFRALPGLSSFSMAMYSPLEDNNWGECVIQQGHPAPGPNERCGSTWVRVSPGFLSSVGVPIVRGRDLSDHDTSNSPQVAIVNETFVKRFFPGKNPIGQRFGIDRTQYSGNWQIVGVFRDFKINNPRGEIRPVYLRPLAQRDMSFKEPELISTESSSLIMQAMIIGFDRPQPNADQLIRQTLASVDRNLTVMDLRTFSNQVAGNFGQERLLARLSALFGVLALVLACVGLYGVMSYFVARRTSEVGIRMALGASRSSVIAMVMRGVAIQVAAGLALGIPAALYAGHLMKSMLYNTASYDAAALVGAPLVLVLCAALAGYIPAHRAASIEPMRALRTE